MSGGFFKDLTKGVAFPFDDYKTNREPYWTKCLEKKPWILLWWACRSIGRVVNIRWIWQDSSERRPELNELKKDLRADIQKYFIKLLDATYVNIIDRDFDIEASLCRLSLGFDSVSLMLSLMS